MTPRYTPQDNTNDAIQRAVLADTLMGYYAASWTPKTKMLDWQRIRDIWIRIATKMADEA